MLWHNMGSNQNLNGMENPLSKKCNSCKKHAFYWPWKWEEIWWCDFQHLWKMNDLVKLSEQLPKKHLISSWACNKLMLHECMLPKIAWEHIKLNGASQQRRPIPIWSISFLLDWCPKYTNSTQYTARWWEQSDKLDASIFAACVNRPKIDSFYWNFSEQ